MFSPAHKTFILERIVKAYEGDLEALVSSAESAYEAATHAESRADNKYDTRGLEASYLAGAQAARAQEIRKLLSLCKAFTPRDYGTSDEISVGALCELRAETGSTQWVFLVPFAGGRSVEVDGVKVNIVSSASPLGEELMGRTSGAFFEVDMRGKSVEYEVLQAI